jgi:hypothetical protein
MGVEERPGQKRGLTASSSGPFHPSIYDGAAAAAAGTASSARHAGDAAVNTAAAPSPGSSRPAAPVRAHIITTIASSPSSPAGYLATLHALYHHPRRHR